MKKTRTWLLPAAVCCMAALLAGCTAAAETKPAETNLAETVDASSSASLTFYQDASFSQERLWESISQFEGSCTIATVNADGTPNLIVAVPGTAGDSHLYFNWADNVTRANVERTGEAMLSYYVYDADAAEKTERNQGARIRVSLETDEAVLEQLRSENPSCSEASTVLFVEEILPLG